MIYKVKPDITHMIFLMSLQVLLSGVAIAVGVYFGLR